MYSTMSHWLAYTAQYELSQEYNCTNLTYVSNSVTFYTKLITMQPSMYGFMLSRVASYKS